MSKFALVSTVDTIKGFPCHEVMLFESREEAVKHAADIVVKHFECAAFVDGLYIIDECDEYSDPEAFIEHFQECLESTEYFHVMPVVDTKK